MSVADEMADMARCFSALTDYTRGSSLRKALAGQELTPQRFRYVMRRNLVVSDAYLQSMMLRAQQMVAIAAATDATRH